MRYPSKVRRKILKGTAKCEICGTKEGLTIHHKVQKSEYRKNHKLQGIVFANKNKEILCRKCHDKKGGQKNGRTKSEVL